MRLPRKSAGRKLILAVFRRAEKLLITGSDGVRVYQRSGRVHERVSLARMEPNYSWMSVKMLRLILN